MEPQMRNSKQKKVRIPNALMNQTEGGTHSPGNLKNLVD